MMPEYRILFFRGHQLDRWEVIEAAGYLEAVRIASERRSDDRVELWSEQGRIATFRPLGGVRRLG